MIAVWESCWPTEGLDNTHDVYQEVEWSVVTGDEAKGVGRLEIVKGCSSVLVVGGS